MAKYYCNSNKSDQGAARAEDDFTCGPESLKEIVDLIGTTNDAIIICEARSVLQTTYTLTTSETVPSNIKLVIEDGAVFDGAGTLTINGPFDAGLHKVFGSTITVVFGEGAAKEYYPQWFGAPVDGTNNDLIACQALADSMTSGTMRLTGGSWTFTTIAAYTSANTGVENGQLILTNPISIKGDGRDHTIITSTSDGTYYAMIVVNGVKGITIDGIALVGTGTAYSTGYGGGIREILSTRVTVQNCRFEDLRGNAYISLGNNVLAAGDTGVSYYSTYAVFTGNILININGDGCYINRSKFARVTNNALNNCGYTDSIIFEGANNGVVDSNIILYPNLRGILLNTGSSYSVASNNSIYLSDSPVGGDGIYLASVRYCNVIGNVIHYEHGVGTARTAIATIPGLLVYQDGYNNISNNVIYNAGSGLEVPAILVQTDYNSITGNKINGGTYGCLVDNSDYNVFKGNYFSGVAGQSIRINDEVGAKPDYTYVVGNYLNIDLYDDGTNTYIADNFPANLAAVTATTAVMDIVTKIYKSVTLDSSGGAITLTVGSGNHIGQILTIIMTEASTSSTVAVTNHDNVDGIPAYDGSTPSGDGEIGTFDAVDETWVLIWTGTEWTTLRATCTFV